MGNSESRFREAVRAGDHKRAYELFYNKKVIRDSIDPKEVCYEQDGSTVLHYTARHAMQPLYEVFLDNGRISPLITDRRQRTCLHLICSKSEDSDVRYGMLKLTIENEFVQGAIVRSLSCPDIDGNTPLHFACESGLRHCVQLLVDSGADATLTNSEGETPADKATLAKHETIAKKLETHIVFAPAKEEEGIVIEMDPPSLMPHNQNHIAMKDQELQSMKDQLLIEAAELLGVSLFTAEALLRNYEWSKEQLLDAWMKNPAETCEKAGVDMPAVLTPDNIDDAVNTTKLGDTAVELDCNICYLPINDLVEIQCEHVFCKDCWQHYLHDKIKSGQVHNIVCPEYACYKLVPIHVVEKLVSRDMAQKYLQFDIKAFVDSNPNIRWCPHPGCGQAITKPSIVAAETEETTPTGITVHCGHDHYFCWDCGQTAHDPCTCEEWKNWLRKVDEMSVQIGSMSRDDFGEAATVLWISAFSKPCPNCKSPIEKNDGCNHMRCASCRYDFCWMCLDPWNKHNSSTGGYFQCNRLKPIEKANEMLRQRKDKSDEYNKITHFQHYHNRYKNHRHSLQLENGYLHSAEEKMQALELSALQEGSAVGSLAFVEEAVRTLVEARHVIAASYGYGYFIMIVRIRDNFEREQGDFEEQVEALAEVVARPHLRKPRADIIRLTRTVRKKKESFVKFVQKELNKEPEPWIPPSTPDYLRQRLDQVRRQQEEEARREELERREEEEERQMQLALQVSKEQYEEDTQLQSDTEFAILLSMKNNDSVQSNDLSNESPAHIDTSTTGISDSFIYPSASQNSDADLCPSFPQRNNLDLQHWRDTLLCGDHWAPSSSSSTGNVTPLNEKSPERPATEYSHFFGNEDEELATAIALSLSTMNDTNDLNTDRGGHSFSPSLRPLQEALHSTSRKAANV